MLCSRGLVPGAIRDLIGSNRIAVHLMMKSGDFFSQLAAARRRRCNPRTMGGIAQSLLHAARRRKGRFAEAKAVNHAPGSGQTRETFHSGKAFPIWRLCEEMSWHHPVVQRS